MIAIISASVFQNPVARLLSYGVYGVEIFFVVSGYCIAAAMSSAAKRENAPIAFLKARLRRIFPTYWASLAFLLLSAWMFVELGGMERSVPDYLLFALHTQSWQVYFSNLTLTQQIWNYPSLTVVSWTLSYELAFYLVCFLSIAFLHKRNKELMLPALHALTVGVAAVMVANYDALPFPLNLWVYFGVGVLLFDSMANPRKKYLYGILIVVAGMLILFAARRVGWICHGLHEPKRSVLVVIGTALLLWLLRSKDESLSRLLPVRALTFVGGFSYSLYLVHYFVLAFVIGLLHPWMGSVSPMLSVALAFVLAIPVAWLFHWFAERPFLSKKRKTEAASD